MAFVKALTLLRRRGPADFAPFFLILEVRWPVIFTRFLELATSARVLTLTLLWRRGLADFAEDLLGS